MNVSRGAKGAIAFGVVLIVLVILAVVAEVVARTLTVETIRDQVRTAVGQSADEATIELDGIVIPQLIAGRLGSVRVAGDDVNVGDFAIDVDVQLNGLPAREGVDTSESSAAGTISIDRASVEELVVSNSDLSSFIATPEVTLGDDLGTLSSAIEIPVIGTELPLSISVSIDVIEGDLALNPQRVTVGDLEFTTDQLSEAPVDLSGIAQPIVVCRGDSLPAGISITGADVHPDRIEVTAHADGRAFALAEIEPESICG